MTIFDQLSQLFEHHRSTKKTRFKKITIFFSLKNLTQKTLSQLFKNDRRSKKIKIVDMAE
jgi:hypothetical protein